MSRRTHVVRTTNVSNDVALPRGQGFTWNAMLCSYQVNSMFAHSTQDLSSEFIRHTTFGELFDFDAELYPTVRIRIPRDGIYSASGRVMVNNMNNSDAAPGVALFLMSNTVNGNLIDNDTRPLSGPAEGQSQGAFHVSHAGYPFMLGDLIWLTVDNQSDYDIETQVGHLSVTYEAALGTVYNKGG